MAAWILQLRDHVADLLSVSRIVASTLLCGVAGIVSAQSLGDAARREAGRRERVAPAADLVYTNADLDSSAADKGAAADETLAASEPADPSAAPTRRDDSVLRERLDRAAARRKEEERRWRRSAEAARALLAEARAEHDAVCHTGAFYVGGG